MPGHLLKQVVITVVRPDKYIPLSDKSAMTTNFYHHASTHRLSKAAEETAATCVFNLRNWAAAVQEIKTWPEY